MAAEQVFDGTWRRRTGRPGRAERHLAEVDAKLGRAIEQVVLASGVPRFAKSEAQSDFDAIVRSIVNQQLSIKAAASIYERLAAALGGTVTPARVMQSSCALLRGAGLSRPKADYLQALAVAVTHKDLRLRRLRSLSDHEVVRALTAVRGLGVWTAQMYLMFRLGREDVLPSGDLGLRHGLRIAYGLEEIPTPRFVEQAGQLWSPYRSIASLYLWGVYDLRRRAQPEGAGAALK